MKDLLGDEIDLAEAAATHLADREDAWPQRLAEMVDVLIDEIARAEPTIGPASTRALAVRLIVRQCAEYGGGNWYWHKIDVLRRALRNLQIWAEHDGTVHGPNGIRALARRYAQSPDSPLSDNAIWKILRRERARHQRRTQRTLPLDD